MMSEEVPKHDEQPGTPDLPLATEETPFIAPPPEGTPFIAPSLVEIKRIRDPEEKDD
jgi:hypothetical protein